MKPEKELTTYQQQLIRSGLQRGELKRRKSSTRSATQMFILAVVLFTVGYFTWNPLVGAVNAFIDGMIDYDNYQMTTEPGQQPAVQGSNEVSVKADDVLRRGRR